MIGMRRALSGVAAMAVLVCLGAAFGVSAEEVEEPAGPERYRAKFETTRGEFVVQVYREWAPLGADRFYELVRTGFYDEVRFFRVVPAFVAQFGLNGDPAVNRRWRENELEDDPVVASNTRGRVAFAASGKNSRTTQVFINLSGNTGLDRMGFAPFGEVVEGMADVVDRLFSGYGERLTRLQPQISWRGNAYLDEKFPELDYVIRATIVDTASAE